VAKARRPNPDPSQDQGRDRDRGHEAQVEDTAADRPQEIDRVAENGLGNKYGSTRLIKIAIVDHIENCASYYYHR
jgi:hypothetical protein